MIWFYPDILKSQENGCFRNIEISNRLSEWYDITEKYLFTILPVFLLILWVHTYCANEGIFAFQYGRNVLFPWYHVTQRSLLQISILRILIKVRKNFCQTKKLFLTWICNFQLDSFKIKVWPIKIAKAYKKLMSLRGAVANFNIAQPTFTSAFNIVSIKPYHSTRGRLPVLCKLWTNPVINLKFSARRW